MSSVRNTIAALAENLEESMGVRRSESRPALTPVPLARDADRRPLRNYGRVPVDAVMPDPNQPRTTFRAEELQRLAGSIQRNGQLAPIRVRWAEEQQKWMIISGERRWRAAIEAGKAEVNCCFQETDMSPSEILEEQLIENCQREDLEPIELAKGLEELMEVNGWTARELADTLHVAPSHVTRSRALLKLPDDIQQLVSHGTIPPRTAYEISKLSSEEAQRTLAKRAATGRLTHEQTTDEVRKLKRKTRPKNRGTTLTFAEHETVRIVISSKRKGTYHEVEQALNEALAEVRHRIQNNVQLF